MISIDFSFDLAYKRQIIISFYPSCAIPTFAWKSLAQVSAMQNLLFAVDFDRLRQGLTVENERMAIRKREKEKGKERDQRQVTGGKRAIVVDAI